MFDSKKTFKIPIFTEKYSICLKSQQNLCLYRCELIDINGKPISFGIARTSMDTINHRFGRELSYSRAMRFYFLTKFGHKQIIDTTNIPHIDDWSN